MKTGETVQEQVDKNYEVFKKILPEIIREHRNRFALMKDGEVIGYYTAVEDAQITADKFFEGQPFSIQKVTIAFTDMMTRSAWPMVFGSSVHWILGRWKSSSNVKMYMALVDAGATCPRCSFPRPWRLCNLAHPRFYPFP